MARSLTQQYGSDATTPSAEYPGGTFRNKNGPVRGTPLEQTWARNIDGFFQRLMKKLGVYYNGTDETALASQFYDSCMHQFGNSTKDPDWTLKDVCADVHALHHYSKPDGVPNILSLGSTTLRDACVGIDRATQRPVLYVLTENDSVVPITGPMVYDASPFSGSALDLSFSVATMESVRSICCDGDYLYVLWRATSGTYYVSRFYMQNISGPVYSGNAVLSMGYGPVGPEYSKIIVASSTHLAVSGDNINGALGVAIISKTLGSGSVVKGNGNCGATEGIPANGRLVSDGIHIFWLVRKPAFASIGSYLYSAKISDPTTSDYSEQTLVTDTDIRALPSALYNYGGSSGTIVCAASNGSIYLFGKSQDIAYPCIQVEMYADANVLDYNAAMGFDGLNFWIQTHQNQPHTTSRMAFLKIPSTQCVYGNAQVTLQSYTASQVLTGITSGVVSDYESGRMLFDGVDMWFISRDGFLIRITNPGMR
jgi:hypothetical protein